ncbi:MAG: histidine kinase [Sphingobacteriaceae bacterium]|nr:histidine kinase [Sphingobacteriaceae bacterium]
MNPHFIFNAINSVQYFITNNDPVSSQKYLAKFAKLIRYVVDNSKPGTIPLNTELEAINLYLELESLRFENRFTYSVVVDESVDVENTQIPSMIIQPYVENSIWHGLMHKKEKGSIEIILEKKDTVLKCIIRDNGIGREQSKEINLANNKTLKKSIGMANTKERLDIINQMNNGGVSVIVTDILDSDNKVTGTCVELNIPM